MELVPPLQPIQFPTRLSTRFWSISVGIFAHSSSICEVRNWCWMRRPGSQSSFQFIPKVFDGVEVSALSQTVKFFHSKFIQPCLYESCHAGQASSNCSRKVGSLTLSKMSWYAEAVRFPFTGSNRTGFHCSRVQWWCALDHSIWCLALYLMWGLCADVQPWNPIPWSLHHTVFKLILMPVEAMESSEHWWLACSRWPRSVTDSLQR